MLMGVYILQWGYVNVGEGKKKYPGICILRWWYINVAGSI